MPCRLFGLGQSCNGRLTSFKTTGGPIGWSNSISRQHFKTTQFSGWCVRNSKQPRACSRSRLKMAETTILVLMLLVFSLFNSTKGDCNACPEPAYLSCPTTASISAYSSKDYSNWCDDSSYYLTITSLQVAQSDGDDDSFVVTVMDEDDYNDFQNSRSYSYYSGIGTGQNSVTCYQFSSPVSFPAGTKVYTVVKCNNWVETCNLRVKIDARCHATDPCGGVSCGSNGYCTNGLCVCKPGYSGARCQYYDDPCLGIYCSGNGVCVNGKCSCNRGYSGVSCLNYDPCVGVDCSGNGDCINGLCSCYSGYSGLSCSNYDPCVGIDCSGNGNCINGLCSCYAGYSGLSCSNYRCLGIDCSGNGYCNELTGECNCVNKYEGSDCSQKKDDNKKNIIIIACSSAGGAILLLLLISAGIAVAIRSRRRGSQQVAVATMGTDPKVTLVTAMEQQ